MLFEHLLDLQRTLDNLFERDVYPTNTFSRGIFPSVNMFEKDDKLLLIAELPGIEKKEINIELKENTLSLSGERNRELKDGANYHRRELKTGVFRRQINLPCIVDPEKVSAQLQDGVLTIELDKAQEAKPRQISIL